MSPDAERERIARALAAAAIAARVAAALGMVAALAAAVIHIVPDAARAERLDARVWIVRGRVCGLCGAAVAWILALAARLVRGPRS